MPTESEAISKNLSEVQDLLYSAQDRIAAVLPRHIRVDRMISVSMELVSDDSMLRKCEPLSILQGVLDASELGLLLIKNLGHGYLVPFKNGKLSAKYNRDVYETTFMIGYRGFLHLIKQGDPEVSNIYSRIVYNDERFEMYEGTRHELIHVPKVAGDRAYKPTGGKITVTRYGKNTEVDELEPDYLGAYSVVTYGPGPHGTRPPDFEWMPMLDIERVRAVSKAQSLDAPWNTWPEEMIRKTPIRRHGKRLKLSPEALAGTVRDEYRELGISEERTYELPRGAYEIRAPQSRSARAAAEADPEPEKPEGNNKAADTTPRIRGELIGRIMTARQKSGKTPQELAAYILEKYQTDILTEIPADQMDSLLAWIGPGKEPEAPKTNGNGKAPIGADAAKKLDAAATASGWPPLEWAAYVKKSFGVDSLSQLPAEHLAAAQKAAQGGT